MGSRLNKNCNADYLFEEIPSDDNSLTDILVDDFDDQDYLPPHQNAIQVVKSNSYDENKDGNDLVEILNLNDGYVFDVT